MSALGWPVPAPASVRLVRVRVPLRTPHRGSHGVEVDRDVVLICWTRTDGGVGWSECPTLSGAGYATETTDRAWAGLVMHLVPAMFTGVSNAAPGLIAATSALLDAALDAALCAMGRSLSDELGGGGRAATALRRCVVLADLGAPPDALAQRAVAAIAEGAEMVKVKIAPGHDVDVLRAVQQAVGNARVAADANGSYEGLHELLPLDGLGLAYLEQPVPAGETWDSLAQLCGALDTPIALDESLVSLDAVRSVVLAGAADVVSIKPARLGGVLAAASAIELAAEHGLDVFVGGMLELGIGRAAAAAVATVPGCSLPTDLGPSSAYVVTDICDPVLLDADGRLVVPSGPGIGRVPDEPVLEQFLVEQITLTA